MKVTDKILSEMAIIYCQTGTPLSKLAVDYGISKTSLVRYFNGEKSIKLGEKAQKLVDEKKRENWYKSKATSGNLGNKKLQQDEIISLANEMVVNNYTLRDLQQMTSVSAATIYNNFTEDILGSELYQKVVNNYEQNKKTGKK